MPHQDGSRHAWLAGELPLDLIVTLDDATSKIYSAFLIEEESTVSTFRALLEVFTAQGLSCSLYTDRGSHYFSPRRRARRWTRANRRKSAARSTGWGIEHIPAYSPEARGRSERMFATLQDRLPKELELAGIVGIEAAMRGDLAPSKAAAPLAAGTSEEECSHLLAHADQGAIAQARPHDGAQPEDAWDRLHRNGGTFAVVMSLARLCLLRFPQANVTLRCGLAARHRPRYVTQTWSLTCPDQREFSPERTHSSRALTLQNSRAA